MSTTIIIVGGEGIMQQLDNLKASIVSLSAAVQKVAADVATLKANQVPSVDPAEIQAQADAVSAAATALQAL